MTDLLKEFGLEFTAEDFRDPIQEGVYLDMSHEAARECANAANALLRERLKPVRVFQRASKPYCGKDFPTGVWTEHRRASDDSEALLCAPRPVKREGV